MEVVLVAICTSTIPAFLAYLGHRRSKEAATRATAAAAATNDLAEKLKTNHGKEPREYLEMAQPTLEAVLEMKSQFLDVKKDILGIKSSLFTLEDAFVEHTRLDSENFEELTKVIKEQK